MALKTKTIEYAFATRREVISNNTRYEFTPITIYIPETVDRTFLSFIVEVYTQDIVTVTGGTIGNRTIGLKLGSAAFEDINESNDDPHSGENASWFFIYDFTDYANSNFGTASSQTCSVATLFNQITGTTLGMCNTSAKLIITYSYNDAAATQIKTVYIPLESPTGAITNILTEIGTNQVPALESFLPENNKVYRDFFFTLEGNQSNTGNLSYCLGAALDSESLHTGYYHESALQSSCYNRYIWSRRNDFPSTGTTHSLYAAITGTGAVFGSQQRFYQLNPLLTVTYEYNHSGSDKLLNSLVLPYSFNGPMGGSTSSDLISTKIPIFICESGVSLKQSAALLNYSTLQDISTVNFSIGNQEYRSYNNKAGTVTCGQFGLQQRFDSLADKGTGISLQTGLNNIILNLYRNDSSTLGFSPGGLIYLNYEANKSNNNRTTIFSLVSRSGAHINTLDIPTGISKVITIPDTYYYVNNYGVKLNYLNDALSTPIVKLFSKIKNDEINLISGHSELLSAQTVTDAEQGVYSIYSDLTNSFNQYPLDNRGKLSITGNREYKIISNGFISFGGYRYLTTHSNTHLISGDLINYDGNGAGVVINFFDTLTNDYLFSLTSQNGGMFTGIWYDNTRQIYATARQSSSYFGRSDNLTV